MITDAYLHVGMPRYGSAKSLLTYMEAAGTDRAVAVHGPGHCDMRAFTELAKASEKSFRFVTVPSANSGRGAIDDLIRFGICGLRIQGSEYTENEDFLSAIGGIGGFLFAIDPFNDRLHAYRLLQWLSEWPDGRVILPHFIKPDASLLDAHVMGKLLEHPRVYPVISRQSGQSSLAYPHQDLWPWLQLLKETVAGKQSLWASEYPVFMYRGEPMQATRSWISECGFIDTGEEHAFFGGRANDIFFGQEPFEANPKVVISDVTSSPVRVPLPSFDLPQPLQAELFETYLEESSPDSITFHHWLVERLSR